MVYRRLCVAFRWLWRRRTSFNTCVLTYLLIYSRKAVVVAVMWRHSRHREGAPDGEESSWTIEIVLSQWAGRSHWVTVVMTSFVTWLMCQCSHWPTHTPKHFHVSPICYRKPTGCTENSIVRTYSGSGNSLWAVRCLLTSSSCSKWSLVLHSHRMK